MVDNTTLLATNKISTDHDTQYSQSILSKITSNQQNQYKSILIISFNQHY